MDDGSEIGIDSTEQLESDNFQGEGLSLQEQYQAALLHTGINAAQLLDELIALKMMPDPRAKEMAEVALQVITIVNKVTMGTKGDR